MNNTIEFLRDEVRSGFYIPTVIKQVWACQLRVLSEIDRVCKKYNITYFAEWGSLLGAVRHGGFVPWDDDLDISMKRADYIRFKSVAAKELPQGFAIHDFESQERHWLFLARVVNHNQICFDLEHLDEYYNFPYIASVDIFVLDYLYEDKEEEKKRSEEIKHLLAVSDGIVFEKFSEETVRGELFKIDKKYDMNLLDLFSSISHKVNKNEKRELRRQIGVELYKLVEIQMGRVPESESSSIGQIFPWILKGGTGLPKEFYETSVRLPFETTDIPVAKGYHKVLSSRYSDYFIVKKVWGGHDYPYFEKQKEALRKVMDFEIPEFTFDEKMLFRGSWEDTHKTSVKGIVSEAIDNLGSMLSGLDEALNIDDYEAVLSYLPECQQLAVDMGTFLENVKGEDNPHVKLIVNSLEDFCESLYKVYELAVAAAGQEYTEDFLPEQQAQIKEKMIGLKAGYEGLSDIVKTELLDRKTVLFIATDGDKWRWFEGIYSDLLKEDVDVQILPVPLLYKNSLGQIRMSNEAIMEATGLDKYPEKLNLMDWTTYSLELHHPDEIYFQDPYDDQNPCLTIPPQFYSKELQKYTNKLIYVPPFRVEEFGDKDSTALYNLKHYVLTPGLVYADLVYVQSDDMRKQWINKLVDFSGEEFCSVWEVKLVTNDNYYVSDGTEPPRRGKILFGIGLNEISEHKDKFIEGISRKLDILDKYTQGLDMDICLYPDDEEVWKSVDYDSSNKLRELLVGRQQVGEDKLSLKELSQYKAYYGSPTPYVHHIGYMKKTVMIMDIEL